MKERELAKHQVCSKCQGSIFQSGVPMFFRVTLEQFVLRVDQIKRQAGLAAFLGSGAVAQIMGPDEDMAELFYKAITLTICHRCSLEMEPCSVQRLYEMEGRHNGQDLD